MQSAVAAGVAMAIPVRALTEVVADVGQVTAMASHSSGRLILARGFGGVGTGELLWLSPETGELEGIAVDGQLGRVSGLWPAGAGEVVVTNEVGSNLVRIDLQTGAQTPWPSPTPGSVGIAVVPAP